MLGAALTAIWAFAIFPLVDTGNFYLIVLAIAGTLLLINFKSYDDNESTYRNIPAVISIFIGGILGFVSGVVGIGGGIFLSPILFLIKAANQNILLQRPLYLFLSILHQELLVN